MPAASKRSVRVAVAQVPSILGDVAANSGSLVETIGKAGREGYDLVVFPECALSGYLFDSGDATRAAAVTLDDEHVAALTKACADHGVHAVVGLLERAGDHTYNTALLIGPAGRLARYRKQHLPFLGADRFVDAGDGDSPRVVDTLVGRIGMMICFDLRFPESARELALQGADLIAMPTNWPTAATFLADHVTRVRALENLVYLAVADRPDAESGTQFLGRSQVVAPNGDVLADAAGRAGLFGATLELDVARNKRLVLIEDEFELPIFAGRRPERYGELTRPLTAAD